MINLIAAVGENGEIGFEGRIPWLNDPRIANVTKADLAWFAKQTENGFLIVGGRTYREMLDMGFRPGTREVAVYDGETDPRTLIEGIETHYSREIWICGGAYTYRKFMPYVQRFYVSRIPWTGKADAFLPPLLPNWGYTGGPVHVR